MWMCRRCAAHVKDEVLSCPCCGTAALARLQPELTGQVTPEVCPDPPRTEIKWLIRRAIPDLRKQAKRTWTGAALGFLLGLGPALDGFLHQPASPGSCVYLFVQPILCAAVLAIYFDIFRRMRHGRWRTWAAEKGAFIGFFTPFSLGLMAFCMNRRSLHELLGSICPLLALSGVFGLMGTVLFGSAALIIEPFIPLLSKLLGLKNTPPPLPPHSALAKTDSLGRH
jgi:hypothetical protein